MYKNFRRVAIESAQKAGRFIKKNLGKIKKVRYKGEINVVTDVDRKAEDIIVHAIKRHFPSHKFFAEEKHHAQKHLLKGKRSPAKDFTWVIDPLDGTTNFFHGFPFFCTSVALICQGNIACGVVYDPMREETFYAEKKKGAFLNGKRIRVSKINSLGKALVATGFAYNVKRVRNNNINNFIRFMKASQAVRRAGAAAIDLCYVACGRYDGFWELYLQPWDTAAAVLIVEEAGGMVTRFNGSTYQIYDKEILASNSKIHFQMIKTLKRQ